MKKCVLVFVLFSLLYSSAMAYYCSCRDYYEYCYDYGYGYNYEYYDYYNCDACYSYFRRHCAPRRYYTTTYITTRRMPRPIPNHHVRYVHHIERPHPMPNRTLQRPPHPHSAIAAARIHNNPPRHSSEIRHSHPSSSIQRNIHHSSPSHPTHHAAHAGGHHGPHGR